MADADAARFDQRRIGLYFDGLGNLTHFKRDIDYRIRIDVQHDTRPGKRPKARQRHLQLVRTGRKTRQNV